jgi:hypothetical protein
MSRIAVELSDKDTQLQSIQAELEALKSRPVRGQFKKANPESVAVKAKSERLLKAEAMMKKIDPTFVPKT